MDAFAQAQEFFRQPDVVAEYSIRNKYELEKSDLLHRYDDNLRKYKALWDSLQGTDKKHDQSGNTVKFFYWLDFGKGVSVNHPRCPRRQLEQQRVRYLKTEEREIYEVRVIRGLFVYRTSGEFVHTRKEKEMIYVVSPTEDIFIGEKDKGTFHHSSFLDGGDVLCAGHMEVCKGKLKALTATSGHYQPTKENLDVCKLLLQKRGVDLKEVEFINPDYGDVPVTYIC